MSTRETALRFSAYYGAVFLALGVYLPFWPLWLESQALTDSQIGLLLAVAAWARIAGTPSIGRLADLTGRTHQATLLAAGAAFCFFLPFLWLESFWPILILHLAWAVTFHPLIPLGESRAMAAAKATEMDYGRVRLWGSLTFILASVGGGALIARQGEALVPVLILAALAATIVAAFLLPGRDRQSVPAAAGPRFTVLFRDRSFLLFLLAASLLQGSHAVYYGFSSLHWTEAGLSEGTVGWLWAEGVIAEVLLFLVAGKLLARFGPAPLLILAGLGGILRWTVLGLTTDLTLLIVAQCLHALTFGAAHLGAVHFIAARAPQGLTTTAQALYASVSGGLVMGATLWLSGKVFAEIGGQAYWIMAGYSLLGFLAALLLWRRLRPG